MSRRSGGGRARGASVEEDRRGGGDLFLLRLGRWRSDRGGRHRLLPPGAQRSDLGRTGGRGGGGISSSTVRFPGRERPDKRQRVGVQRGIFGVQQSRSLRLRPVHADNNDAEPTAPQTWAKTGGSINLIAFRNHSEALDPTAFKPLTIEALLRLSPRTCRGRPPRVTCRRSAIAPPPLLPRWTSWPLRSRTRRPCRRRRRERQSLTHWLNPPWRMPLPRRLLPRTEGPRRSPPQTLPPSRRSGWLCQNMLLPLAAGRDQNHPQKMRPRRRTRPMPHPWWWTGPKPRRASSGSPRKSGESGRGGADMGGSDSGGAGTLESSISMIYLH
mmetsp:Transcript_22959/g.67775  ORF Transcript_22959/g.67775 Transcript_22959/m.67775 type:complete len:327 (-) Transcript_22959:36-1016(-)